MLRKLMLAVIPMAALSGAVRADDFDFGLAELSSDSSSFEVDALTAALTGDDLTATDADVMALEGSADNDLDAEAVGCYGYYRGFRRAYHYGGCYNTFRCYRPVYRPVYHCYRPVIRHCYTPIVRHCYYRNYCW